MLTPRRLAVVAAVAALVLPGPASAHTHIEIGVVFRAGDGTSPDGAAWRSWPAADPSLVVTGPPGADVVVGGRFFGDVGPPRVGVDDVTGIARTWAGSDFDRVVVVELPMTDAVAPCAPAGYFAGTRAGVSWSSGSYPDSQLVPIPAPTAVVEGTDVRVSWTHAVQDPGGTGATPVLEAQGVAGYVVLRSRGGVGFTEVSRVLTALGPHEIVDGAVPPGRWLYHVRLVFAGGVEGRHVSRPAVAIIPGAVTDSDRDGVPDLDDNCPALANGCQLDEDGDGTGDSCDVGDGLILITSVTRMRIAWQDERPPYDAFAVYRGDLATLRDGGPPAQTPGDHPSAQRTCGIAAAALDDPTLPAPGRALFYLVAGQLGPARGGLGRDSAQRLRPNASPCP